MNIVKSMLIPGAFIITSSVYAANFSGVYKIIQGSCIKDNRVYDEPKEVSSLDVLGILNSPAQPFELSTVSLYENQELVIEHSIDSLKLRIIKVSQDFVTMDFEDSCGLFHNISVGDCHDEVIVAVRDITLLAQKYGKMAIRKSGINNDIEIETTFQFNPILHGKVDQTVKCRLAKQ
jgi:hypothetical protein